MIRGSPCEGQNKPIPSMRVGSDPERGSGCCETICFELYNLFCVFSRDVGLVRIGTLVAEPGKTEPKVREGSSQHYSPGGA